MHAAVLLPSGNAPMTLAMDLYLRLTGLTAAGAALLLAPDDVRHLPNIHAPDLTIYLSSHSTHTRYHTARSYIYQRILPNIAARI